MTINNIVNEFKKIAENHKQINTFGFGELPEYGKSKALVYSVMWVVQMPSNVIDRVLKLRYKIFFLDLVHKGLENENDVSSDLMQVALDVIEQLKFEDYDWDFEQNASLENVYGKEDDQVTGWVLDCTLSLPIENNICDIPFTTPPVIGEGCECGGGTGISSFVVKNSNGSFEITSSTSPYILPNETINIYVDNILNTTGTYIPLSGQTINITVA